MAEELDRGSDLDAAFEEFAARVHGGDDQDIAGAAGFQSPALIYWTSPIKRRSSGGSGFADPTCARWGPRTTPDLPPRNCCRGETAYLPSSY